MDGCRWYDDPIIPYLFRQFSHSSNVQKGGLPVPLFRLLAAICVCLSAFRGRWKVLGGPVYFYFVLRWWHLEARYFWIIFILPRILSMNRWSWSLPPSILTVKFIHLFMKQFHVTYVCLFWLVLLTFFFLLVNFRSGQSDVCLLVADNYRNKRKVSKSDIQPVIQTKVAQPLSQHIHPSQGVTDKNEWLCAKKVSNFGLLSNFYTGPIYSLKIKWIIDITYSIFNWVQYYLQLYSIPGLD